MRRQIAQNIKKQQRNIISVYPSKDGEVGFTYTIGNHTRGLPELLIIGFWGNPIGGLLNLLSDKLIERGRPFDNGEFVDLGAKYPVRIIDADDRAQRDYTVQCGQFFGHEDYAVQQVIGCDREGRWPDNPQCDAPYKVPILGRLAMKMAS
jgi:Domain of unknown function (DUF4262)